MRRGSVAAVVAWVVWTVGVPSAQAENRSTDKVVGDMIKIIYDFAAERPWEEKVYWQEIQARWQAFRELACPQVSSLCSLSGEVNDVQGVRRLAERFVQPTTLNELRPFLAAHGLHIDQVTSPVYLYGPFNLLVSRTNVDHPERQLKIWDMEGTIRQRDKSDLVVFDLGSYREGFSARWNPALFGVGQDGAAVVNVDIVKSYAFEMSRQWRDHMLAISANRAELSKRSLDVVMDVEEIVYTKAYHHYQSTLPLRRTADSHMAFFKLTEAKLHEVAVAQAHYFALAQQFRPNTPAEAQYMESLLYAATQVEPEFFGLLVLQSLGSAVANPLSHQFARPVVNRLLQEMLDAIVEVGSYENNGVHFAKFQHMLPLANARSVDYLMENAPDALEDLYNNLGQNSVHHLRKEGESWMIDVTSLPLNNRQRFYQNVFRDDEGKTRRAGFYHLTRSLLGNFTDAKFKELIEVVHSTRNNRFVFGSRCSPHCDWSPSI